MTSSGVEYAGKINITKHGKPCQPWIDYTEAVARDFPDGKLNYLLILRFTVWNHVSDILRRRNKRYAYNCPLFQSLVSGVVYVVHLPIKVVMLTSMQCLEQQKCSSGERSALQFCLLPCGKYDTLLRHTLFLF